ncbi:MAG: methionine--tRNA ligase subunit beta [Candidatus Atabeyarchaeum deiterrae]
MSQNITLSDFQKFEIKVCRIKVAEKLASSKKLIKLKVDLGNEIREVVAGVAEYYSSEDLEDKNVIVLANLEPRKLMGVQSQGMLLAADVDGRPYLIFADPSIPPGTKVR